MKYSVLSQLSLLAAWSINLFRRKEDVTGERIRDFIRRIRERFLRFRGNLAERIYCAATVIAPSARLAPALAEMSYSPLVADTYAPSSVFTVADTYAPSPVLTVADGWEVVSAVDAPSVPQEASAAPVAPTMPEPVRRRQGGVQTLQMPTLTATSGEVAHVKSVRQSGGKKRTDYRRAREVQLGGLYWYKVGRKWVELEAPHEVIPDPTKIEFDLWLSGSRMEAVRAYRQRLGHHPLSSISRLFRTWAEWLKHTPPMEA